VDIQKRKYINIEKHNNDDNTHELAPH